MERNRVTLATACTLTAALGVLVFLAARLVESTLEVTDVRIAEAVYDLHNPVLHLLMRLASPFGSTVGVIVVTAALGAFIWRRGDRRAAVIACSTILAAILLNPILKLMFARPRPELFPLIRLPQSYAFPSGHTVGATVAYAVVAMVLTRYRPEWRTRLRAGAAVIIVLVGAARVYLGVHWPGDVAAGWAFGAMMATVGWRLLRRGTSLSVVNRGSNE